MIQFQLRLPINPSLERRRGPQRETVQLEGVTVLRTQPSALPGFRDPSPAAEHGLLQRRAGAAPTPAAPSCCYLPAPGRPPLSIQAHPGRRATGRGPGPEWPCGSPRGGGSPLADPPRAAGRLAPRPETTPLPLVPRATPRSPDRAAPRPRRDPVCARSAYLARQSSALAAARAGRCRGARGTGRGGRCPGRAGRAAAESAPRRRGRAPASRREGALSGAAAVLAF